VPEGPTPAASCAGIPATCHVDSSTEADRLHRATARVGHPAAHLQVAQAIGGGRKTFEPQRQEDEYARIDASCPDRKTMQGELKMKKRSCVLRTTLLSAAIAALPTIASAGPHTPTCAELGTDHKWGIAGNHSIANPSMAIVPASGPNGAYCQVLFTDVSLESKKASRPNARSSLFRMRETGVGTPNRPAIAAGDVAPPCALRALDGSFIDIRTDAVAGNPIVLLFCPRSAEAIDETLWAFVEAQPGFVATSARLFVVTLEGEARARSQCIALPVLLDREAAVFRAFGADTGERPIAVVLRPNQHVMAILDSAPRLQAAHALALVERLAVERRTTPMTHHPPVLLLPDVLSPEDCPNLINV
jgi:hypothetical protein